MDGLTTRLDHSTGDSGEHFIFGIDDGGENLDVIPIGLAHPPPIQEVMISSHFGSSDESLGSQDDILDQVPEAPHYACEGGPLSAIMRNETADFRYESSYSSEVSDVLNAPHRACEGRCISTSVILLS